MNERGRRPREHHLYFNPVTRIFIPKRFDGGKPSSNELHFFYNKENRSMLRGEQVPRPIPLRLDPILRRFVLRCLRKQARKVHLRHRLVHRCGLSRLPGAYRIVLPPCSYSTGSLPNDERGRRLYRFRSSLPTAHGARVGAFSRLPPTRSPGTAPKPRTRHRHRKNKPHRLQHLRALRSIRTYPHVLCEPI